MAPCSGTRATPSACSTCSYGPARRENIVTVPRSLEERRRWFASADLDLIVWFDDADSPIAFQLCYDKLRSERALTWKPDTGFVHMVVDSGERQGALRYK